MHWLTQIDWPLSLSVVITYWLGYAVGRLDGWRAALAAMVERVEQCHEERR